MRGDSPLISMNCIGTPHAHNFTKWRYFNIF
jgi:hypothetical protein